MRGRIELPDKVRDEDIDPKEDFHQLELTVVGGNPGALAVLGNLKAGLSDEGYKQAVRVLSAEGAKGELLYLRKHDIYMRAANQEWPFREETT